MAFKIAEAFVEIKGDKGKFSGTIRSAKKETDGFAKSATKSFKKVSLGLVAIAAAATAAILVFRKLLRIIVRVGSAVIKSAVDYDKLKIGLKAVAGSSLEAQRQLRRLEKVARLPGLSFRGAIAGSTALQAAGQSARLAERGLLAFGNALVTVGKGAHELQGVNLALQQILTKQTGFGQELRQLAERLPQVRQAMKDAFGIGSVEDFKKLGLSAKEFIEGIVTEFEKLPKVAGTVANDLENLGIAFDRLKDEIGQTMLGAVSDVSKGMTAIIDNIREIIPVFGIIREEATRAFIEVAAIGVKATAEMLRGMSKVIKLSADIMWQPLKAGLKIALLEAISEIPGLLAPVQIFGGFQKVFEKLPKSVKNFADEIDSISPGPGMGEITNFFDGIQAKLDEMVKSKSAEIWADGVEDAVDKATANLPKITAEIESVINAFVVNLEEAQNTLASTTIKTRQAQEAWIALRDGVLGTLQAFGLMEKSRAGDEVEKQAKALAKLTGGRGTTLGFLPEIIGIDRIKEAEKRLDDFRGMIAGKESKRQETLLAKFREFLAQRRKAWETLAQIRIKIAQEWDNRRDALAARDRARFRNLAQEEITTMQDVFDAMKEGNEEANRIRVKRNLKTINILLRMEKNRINSLKRIWTNYTGDIQRAFTDAFAEMLEKGEANWSKFANTLKRVFLRKLADIIVTQAFKGLFALLNRLDRAVLRPVGGTTTTGGGGGTNTGAVLTEAGEKLDESLDAPGAVNVIFPNADIEHMSQERIERAVQRQIVPALRNMQKRGIIATRR